VQKAAGLLPTTSRTIKQTDRVRRIGGDAGFDRG
jgi:hypothetical protein